MKFIDLVIMRGLVRGNWADAWAHSEEEKGVSFSGVDLYEVAPEANDEANAWGKDAAAALAHANDGRSLGDLYDRAVKAGFRGDGEHFGCALGMAVAGHGVDWTDDAPAGAEDEAGIEIPRMEFYVEAE